MGGGCDVGAVFVRGGWGDALQRTAVVSHTLGFKKRRGGDVVCVCGGGGCSAKNDSWFATPLV